MGQTSSNTAGSENEVPSKSHYELLDVLPSASEDDIKRAYRRKALELHPDRNYGQEASATALFAEIQTAYSVLSDPQERAWYDAHQAEFLSGNNGEGEAVHYERNVKVTTAEDIRAMCASRSSAFSDFSDSPNGFFNNVRELFERLAMEEGIASANAGWEPIDYPSFGSSKDEFQDVVKNFYSRWGGFSTAKTFAWKDMYRPTADHDRRTRRAMDKENQKARDEAIKEFNDAVRALVLFVRRRDPRYVATASTDAERQKALREAAAAQAARARKANAEKLAGQAVPDWAQSRGDEEADDFATEDEEEDDEEDDEKEMEPEIWECVVCSKTFKSEGQYDAHERSKKHKQAVFKLKRVMREEGIELGLESNSNETNQPTSEDDKDSASELVKEVDEKLIVDDTQSQNLSLANEYGNIDTHINEATPAITQPLGSPDTPSDSEEGEDGGDDSYAPRSRIESRILGKTPEPTDSTSGISTPFSHDSEGETGGTGVSTPSKTPAKMGKAKEKRAKRAAKEAAGKFNAASVAENGELDCVACKEVFASKNKLFEHIKRTGHARPVGDNASRVKRKGNAR